MTATFSAYDYGHIMNAMKLGLKAAEDSCNATDQDIGAIKYGIKMLEMHRDEFFAPAPTKYFADQVEQWGSN